jgi:radical SAM superfamily enzyme YgiQ (UPF0313 family)
LLPIIGRTAPAARQPRIERRLLLLSLDWTRAKDPRIPLGHASLMASLHESGVPVSGYSFAVNEEGFSAAQVIDLVDREASLAGPAALDLGVGAYVWNEPHLQVILRELRRRGFTGHIILGGPQISYQGDGLEQLYPEVDVFVRGYGERALVEVMRAAEPAPIDGVHWAGTHDRGSIARVDLDSLPSPFLGGEVVFGGAQRFVRWETKRGCPYRCSFCQHREAGSRLLSGELDHGRLRDELALLVRSGVDDIAILDPIFNMGHRYLDIVHEFRRLEYTGRLSVQCRFEALKAEFLDVCADLDITLEFGLQTIHPQEGQAIDRKNQMNKVERAFVQLRNRGIQFEVSLIFGLPNQTVTSFRQSVEFCLQRRAPRIRAFPLMLLRGTRLAAERERWGLVENREPIPAVVRSHTFSESDWQLMASIAHALDATSEEHPTSIEALEVLATDTPTPPDVWSPALPAVGPA